MEFVGQRGAIAALILLGFASGGAPALSQEAATSQFGAGLVASSFEISDSRTEKDRMTRVLSSSASSCEFAVTNIGDMHVSGRVEGLRKFLLDRFGDRLIDHRIDVIEYGIYHNLQNMEIGTMPLPNRIISGVLFN